MSEIILGGVLLECQNRRIGRAFNRNPLKSLEADFGIRDGIVEVGGSIPPGSTNQNKGLAGNG